MRPAVKTVLYGRNSLDDYVRAGLAYVANPTTDTGYKLYGLGRLTLPAATVICIDPCGTASTFWGTSTAHTTLTPNTAVPLAVPDNALITKCLKLEHDGTADAPVTANITVVASTSYNDSIYVFAPTLGGNLTITSETGHTFTVAALTGANAGWIRYSMQANTVAAEVTKSLKFTFAGGAASTVYVTGYNPIASSVLTPYGDGSYPGWAWSNPALPNASTSVRTASALTLPSPPGFQGGLAGTIALRAVYLEASGMLEEALLETGSLAPAIYTPDGTTWGFGCYISGGTPSLAHGGASAWAIGEPRFGVLRWDNATMDVNHQGIDGPQVGRTGTGTPGSTIKLGNGMWKVPRGHYIGPVLISPVNAPAAYVTAVQANGGALYSNVVGMVELARRYSLQPFLLLPLQGDSVGYVVTG